MRFNLKVSSHCSDPCEVPTRLLPSETLQLLQRLLKSPGCRKIPVLVQSRDDVIITASNFSSERLCPIFQVSNVSRQNVDLLKVFLNLLSSRTSYRDDQPAEFQIDDTYSVPGVGTVVSGTTLRGLIRLNDTMLLGPDPLGSFLSIAVKSIHRKRMVVKEVRGGQTASFALKKVKREGGRGRGAEPLYPFGAGPPPATRPWVGVPGGSHQTLGGVHCGSIRQTATILTMSRACLRTGDKAAVRLRFIKTPEYLLRHQRLVFREGRTKAVGTITKLLQSSNHLPSNSKPPQIKMQSTKKVPPRWEEGPSMANEEAPTAISLTATQNSSQPPKGGGEEGRDTEGKDRPPPPQPLRPIQGWRTAERTHSHPHTHPPPFSCYPSHAILTKYSNIPTWCLYFYLVLLFPRPDEIRTT
ncbi:unnamed protein product [Arctogadus glacialis]